MANPPAASAPLRPGTPAPQFSLAASPKQTISLRDLTGQAVVLIFYPADFSPVCSDELALFNELLPDLKALGAQVLGISVDGIWSHLAFARERKLRFPLLADFHPKGEVCRRYQAYRELEGYAERALYVIDREGVIAWSHLSPPEVNPGVDGVLEALERLPPHSEPPEALS